MTIAQNNTSSTSGDSLDNSLDISVDILHEDADSDSGDEGNESLELSSPPLESISLDMLEAYSQVFNNQGEYL